MIINFLWFSFIRLTIDSNNNNNIFFVYFFFSVFSSYTLLSHLLIIQFVSVNYFHSNIYLCKIYWGRHREYIEQEKWRKYILSVTNQPNNRIQWMSESDRKQTRTTEISAFFFTDKINPIMSGILFSFRCTRNIQWRKQNI